jgi:hypothetical protein
MVVKMRSGASPVSAQLTINGIVHWAYLFDSPDHTYKNSGISNAVNVLPLGMPSDLNLDPHEWTIHVANQTGATVPVDVKLEFLQAGKTLDTWSKSQDLKPGDDAVFDDRAILVIDPSVAAGGGI